ncbi:hypothetical protein D5086_022147 [Populus alba]|uniref:Uncharacterized protein n=1 Tax=Populus alba TaxID=43335 RepID=A0ACC4BFN2_POPAL
MTPNYNFNVTFVNNLDEVSIVYGMNNPSIISRMVVDESGLVQRLTWNGRDQRWIGFWSTSREQCDTYRQCAKYEKLGPLAKGGIQAALIVSVGVALFLIVFLVYWFVRKTKKGKQIPSTVIPEH